MNRLQALHDAGVSIWLDTLSRELLDSGAFATLIADSAVTGATSNPTIFAKAITGSDSYDDQLAAAAASGVRDPQELFFAIALDDVGARRRSAAAQLRGERRPRRLRVLRVHTRPRRRHRRARSSRRSTLWSRLARPNVMIKVPATDAGDPRDRGAHRPRGQRQRHAAVLRRALRAGDRRLHRRPRATHRERPAGRPHRLGRLVLRLPDRRQGRRLPWPSTRSCGGRWRSRTRSAPTPVTAPASPTSAGSPCGAPGGQRQRPLWASTGTKDPAYSDVLYVERLIAPDVINTMPEATLRAFADHGDVGAALGRRRGGSRRDPSRRERSGHRSRCDHDRAGARRGALVLRLLPRVAGPHRDQRGANERDDIAARISSSG